MVGEPPTAARPDPFTRRRLLVAGAQAALGVILAGCDRGVTKTTAPEARPAVPTAVAITEAPVPSATAEAMTPATAVATDAATRGATTAPSSRSTPHATPHPTALPGLTPEPTPEVVQAQSVRFSVPQSLSLRFAAGVVPEASGADLPAFVVNPRLLRFSAPPAGGTADPSSYELLILPVRRYREISDVAGGELDRLKTLLTTKPDLGSHFPAYPPGAERTSSEQYLPILPTVNATPVLQVKPVYLPFQDGTGIRWLTHLSQQLPTPIDTEQLEYRFQGLTSDGSWCVAARFPASAQLDTTATPPPVERWPNSPRDIALYNQQVVDQLGALPDQQFAPKLDALDELLRSLTVGTAPLPAGG